MNAVFLDESGYTGTRLLDPAQPIFALASHNLSEEESRGLKDRFFGAVKAKELKASDLMRRPSGQRMIISFLKELKARHERTGIAYAHKPFSLLCKSIDWLVEPWVRRQGVDLYARGANLALCNVLFVMLEQFPQYRDRLLSALYDLVSAFSRQTATQSLAVLADRPAPLAKPLQILENAIRFIHRDDACYLGKENLDICLSLAKVVMDSWGRRLGHRMVLYHDATTNMAKQADQWATFVAPDVEEKLVGYDRRTVQYPIGVTKTEFVTSDDWAGIQLADILVGVVTRWVKWQHGFIEADDIIDQLREQFVGWPLCGSVVPEAKFTPQVLGTDGPLHADPMDFGMELFRKKFEGGDTDHAV